MGFPRSSGVPLLALPAGVEEKVLEAIEGPTSTAELLESLEWREWANKAGWEPIRFFQEALNYLERNGKVHSGPNPTMWYPGPKVTLDAADRVVDRVLSKRRPGSG